MEQREIGRQVVGRGWQIDIGEIITTIPKITLDTRISASVQNDYSANANLI